MFCVLQTSSLPDGLNMERLKAILKGYGEYPTKYRYITSLGVKMQTF